MWFIVSISKIRRAPMLTFVLSGVLFTFQLNRPGLDASLFQLPPTCRPRTHGPCHKCFNSGKPHIKNKNPENQNQNHPGVAHPRSPEYYGLKRRRAPRLTFGLSGVWCTCQ